MGRGSAASEIVVASQKWGHGPSYGAMRSEDRAAVFGVECVQAMEWRNWRPGKEYERTLVLKNVGTKSIRIKYQLPATKYFSMDFPEPTKIGPGLTWAVKVLSHTISASR